MPCMTLGDSLTGVIYAQQAWLHMQCQTACMSLTEALFLDDVSTETLLVRKRYLSFY